jgi:uncharacterized protein YaiI (UPF0178 family)
LFRGNAITASRRSSPPVLRGAGFARMSFADADTKPGDDYAATHARMTDIYVDGDACPVRDEVYRVADRLDLQVFVVSNGSRPILPPRNPRIRMIVVTEGADKADDWIAERITGADVCVTADIPLAARCLARQARAVSPSGKIWTPNNIGNALAGREISRHLRELGVATRGQAPFSKSDRSRFLNALDQVVQAARRVGGAPEPA